MNLTELQDESSRLLGDPNHDRWSTTTLTTRINLAQIEIQGYTNAVVAGQNPTVTEDDSTLALNANTMNILRVYKTLTDNIRRPLNLVSLIQLDFYYPDWRTWDNGEPIFCYYDATNQNLVVAPAPDATFAGISNPITVFYSAKPADLAASTDVPFDSNNQMIPYHMAIVHWVVAHCFMDDGTPEALAKAKFHRSGNMQNPGEYEKELGRIMAEFDVPDSVPNRILWKPQGGRLGYVYFPQKSNPFLY